MIRITPLHILLLLLQLWATATGDRSASLRPAAPPLAQLHDTDPSFVPIAVAFGCILLFVGFFTIYLWYCADTSFAAAVGDPTRAFTTCCSCDPHGIDRKILDTFPILTYSTIAHLKPRIVPLECMVCLSEFNHQDTLRLLPKCNHAFHRDCIDKWLASHVTCPVCRTRLSKSSFHHHHHRGDNEEVTASEAMMILNNEENNAHREVDESSISRMNYVLSFEEASLRRCHTMGHSLGVGLPPDNVSQQIPANYGRSASDGGSREELGHSLTPPFVSPANVLPSSSSSSSPQHIALQSERRSI
ncbi:hypothetical protein K1719_028330 [Acacia pycnantha]|nr:hypothetical protein K1719_028330 [Acacia pycnantha]